MEAACACQNCIGIAYPCRNWDAMRLNTHELRSGPTKSAAFICVTNAHLIFSPRTNLVSLAVLYARDYTEGNWHNKTMIIAHFVDVGGSERCTYTEHEIKGNVRSAEACLCACVMSARLACICGWMDEWMESCIYVTMYVDLLMSMMSRWNDVHATRMNVQTYMDTCMDAYADMCNTCIHRRTRRCNSCMHKHGS